MSLSSFSVVMNALSLNLQAIFKRKTKILPENKETKAMTKEITVKGMMCPHCEAHVKAALEAIDGVDSCVASHKENKVTLTLSKSVDERVISEAIIKAGYSVE